MTSLEKSQQVGFIRRYYLKNRILEIFQDKIRTIALADSRSNYCVIK